MYLAFLDKYPPIWQNLLEEICKLVETYNKTINDIIPYIYDRFRIREFIKFWKNKIPKEHIWLKNVITCMENNIHYK